MSDPQFAAFEAAAGGRFAIAGEIGRGPRAVVYRARDIVRNDTVAIKILHADLASALDTGHFLREMAHAQEVVHPGIVPLLGATEIAGRLVCITPLLHGETLRARLERERQLPLSDAVTSVHEPRAASGGVEIDARADLYSPGCVFYEMLAGEPPFTGATPQAVWMRTLTDSPVPVNVHRDSLPADVGVTLDRLLAKARPLGTRTPGTSSMRCRRSVPNAKATRRE